MTITLPYPPSLNNLYATVRGRRVLSRDGRAYKTSAAIVMRGIPKLIDCDIQVVARFYRPRRAGDLDNCLKAVLDSVTGIGWEDDRQVTRIVAERFEDKGNPRVEIEIAPAKNGASQ